MAKYRALGPLYIRGLIVPGEEFESDLPPGRKWEPLDDEAKAAVAKFRGDNAKLLEVVERRDPLVRDPASVEIPDGWKVLHWTQRRALAQKLGAQSNVKPDDADSFINAELERRSQKAA